MDAKARWGIASRAFAAILGGYFLAAMTSAWLAVALPGERSQTAIAATLISLVVYVMAVLWAFAVRSAPRAWAGILLPAACMAGALWLGVQGALR